MEVPTDILEKLKCNDCNGYLSHSPVYIKNNSVTQCGHCFDMNKEEDYVTRVLVYESVAKLLTFPCKFNFVGCQESVPFDDNQHENVCEFKIRACPVQTDCEWVGINNNIFEHCQNVHGEYLATNPCELTLDISRFNIKTYVIHCFGVLFLLYTKVCIATGKIYHTVQLIKESKNIFTYTLDIKCQNLLISRSGNVALRNTDFQESSIVTNINSLIDFVPNLRTTTFTISIQQTEIPDDNNETIIKRHCRNKPTGCGFTETDMKCFKHEEFFCGYRNWCWTCWSPVDLTIKAAWYKHYSTFHQNYTHDGDTFFKVQPTGPIGRTCYVKTKVGYVCCRYYVTDSGFKVYIWSKCSSADLDKFHAVLQVQSDDDIVCDEILQVHTNKMWDWYHEIKESDVDEWDKKNVEMSLQIIKK